MRYINILEKEFCSSYAGLKIMGFTGTIFNILTIVVPIILVIMGMIDLVKALVTNEDNEMKKAKGMLVKRIICGTLIFFIMPIVTMIIGMADENWNINQECFYNFRNPDYALEKGKYSNDFLSEYTEESTSTITGS